MSDADPPTQTNWPTTRKSTGPIPPEQLRTPLLERLPENVRTPANTTREPKLDKRQEEIGRKRLTPWDLFCLSISMLGAQVVWTVELGYAPVTF